MSQRTLKHVVAIFIPHLITMTLSGSGKEKLFKLRKLSLSKQVSSPTSSNVRLNKPERGISINKDKDVNDLLRMYDKIDSLVNTPIMPPNMLGPDLNGKAVNESQYRGMIGQLMNLTTSKPNIQFLTALCKTSSKHNESHLLFVENFQVSKWSFFLDVIKSLSLEYEHVAMNLTLLERGRFILRTSLTGFPAQSVRSSNACALDSLYLLVSLYRTPQSRLPH
ncbi:hypothetical protein Tco_0982449 [Tanacetum coccineum]